MSRPLLSAMLRTFEGLPLMSRKFVSCFADMGKAWVAIAQTMPCVQGGNVSEP